MAEPLAAPVDQADDEPRPAERAPARTRDPHAAYVGELFARFRGSLSSYLRGLLKRQDDADDVLQEAYARLLGSPDLERCEGRARAYLFRVATNLAFDRFRRRRARGIHEPLEAAEHASPAPTPEQIVGFEQGLSAVKRTLLELEPRCRRVFLLRAVEQLSYEEIAARLGVSKRTVEREMRHALHACQLRLKE